MGGGKNKGRGEETRHDRVCVVVSNRGVPSFLGILDERVK